MAGADFRFAAIHDRERDLARLAGLLRGIALDGHIKPSELNALFGWCAEVRLRNSDVFEEAVSRIEAAARDGVFDEEARADLLHFCDRLSLPTGQLDQFTRDMQVLHGMLGGVAADGVIVKQELKALRRWLDESTHLAGLWPYDEIDRLITTALSDGLLDENEQHFLLAFTSQFLGRENELRLETQADVLVKYGICAANPQLTFAGKIFVITGESTRPRKELHDEIARLGGVVHNGMSALANYLVVCATGSHAWAFSCYGRKVEQAMALRKQGVRVTIVHETDFWARAAEVSPRRFAPAATKQPLLASGGTSVNGAIREALEKLLAEAPDAERRALYGAALQEWANQ